MRLFVTGATGFVGSHFVERALAAEHEVIALRRSPESAPRILLRHQPEWIQKSFDQLQVSDFDSVDVLVHLAAVGVSPQPASWTLCYRVNVFESLRLVEMALGAGVPRVVVAGSCGEYGEAGLRYERIPPSAPLEPNEPYAASKASSAIALCALCRSKTFKLSYLRLFLVYGQGQYKKNLWPSMRNAALAGENFPMTAGEQIRDFIAVEEVAKKLLYACERGDIVAGRPHIENIGTGQAQSVRAFASHWWQRWNARGSLLFGAIPYRADEIMRYVPEISDERVGWVDSEGRVSQYE